MFGGAKLRSLLEISADKNVNRINCRVEERLRESKQEHPSSYHSWAYLCCVYAVLSHSVVSDSANPWAMAHDAPLSVGILQARILGWVAMTSSKGSSQPRV